jgi:hypothetical protein
MDRGRIAACAQRATRECVRGVSFCALLGVAVAGSGSSGAASPTFAPYQTIPIGSWPNAVAAADLDGDGRTDVVVATQAYFDPANDYKLFVFFQNADGTLAPPIKLDAGNGTSVGIGDLDGDGRLDIATTFADGIGVYHGQPNRAFDAPVRHMAPNASHLLRVADINGDGRADVIAIDWGSPLATIFHQTAAHVLAPPVTVPAPHNGYNDLKVADLDNDGRLDVVLSSLQSIGGQQVVVLMQKADGTLDVPRFVPYAFGPFAPWAIEAIDVDGDGARDIVATQAWNSPESKLIVLRNEGLSFAAADIFTSYDSPEPMATADFNGDGLTDLAVLHGGWVQAGVYTRSAGGGLAAEVLFPIPYASHYSAQGIAIGDLNHDGRPDIAIADYNSGLVILYNTTPPAVAPPAVPVPSLSAAALGTLVLAMAALFATSLRASARYRC